MQSLFGDQIESVSVGYEVEAYEPFFGVDYRDGDGLVAPGMTTVNKTGKIEFVSLGASDIGRLLDVSFDLYTYTNGYGPYIHDGSTGQSGTVSLEADFYNSLHLTGVEGGLAIVPIPGAVWLLGSGLIGIVGVRRKFKKK
ncbi:hypothetical protein C6A36_01360 [Desulfobacteraceae bacterium SEEP-SAG10]|nr:hypothetical protein C6A36_01360 [Desulfobacteraceae bacterium SEEP-SAG10]